jgi:F-type H+-transporting ATPase subunit b
MDIKISDVVFTVINIALMFWLLSKWLFKPVKEFMDNRTQQIQKDINDAAKLKEDAKSAKEQYDEKLKAIHSERDQILLEGKKKADKQFEARINEADEEADRIKERAQRELAQERLQMVEELKGNAVDLAIGAASKIISEELSEDKHKKLVAGFIDNLK